MSEKIYACLLRFFPSAFRARYEKEGLWLLRDRLRDEKGLFRRMSLTVALIVDMIGALPQAYRNSYAEPAAVVAAAPRFDGIPSFQSLHNEPIRRGAFLLAGTLTLTTLAVFGYLMRLPNPYIGSQPDGRKSPIESVLERINKPAPSTPSENTPTSLPPASKAENQPISATNAAPPPVRVAPHAAGQFPATVKPLPGSTPNSSAGLFDHAPLPADAAPSSSLTAARQPLQSQTTGIPHPAQAVNPSIPRGLMALPLNLSGRWIGSVSGSGEIPGFFIFNQRNSLLSGTGGPDASDQYPILHGSVAGNSLHFEINHEQETFLYGLRVEGNELRGTLSIRSAFATRTVEVRLQRVLER